MLQPSTRMPAPGSGDQKSKRIAYPKGRQLDPADRAEVKRILGDRPHGREYLIENLHALQDAVGYLYVPHLAALAAEMGLAQTEVYEVATFYHYFDIVREDDTLPARLAVRVCDGIVCQMAGADALLDDLKVELGGDVRVIHSPCIGACDCAPAVIVGRHRVGGATTENVAEIVGAGATDHGETPAFTDFDAYQAAGGYRQIKALRDGTISRDDLFETLETANLRGMGGAGFPVARKWRFLDGTPKPRALVVNADEGEPGTFKDRYCFETDPHRVIEGVLIAAWAVEADDAYIYLREEYPHIHDFLADEIAKVEAAGLNGGTRLWLRRGAGAYICGEETALLESLEGKRGMPRNKPPYPALVGLFGKPTLINNVETLYWIPEILEKGAEWYQNEGRPRFYSVSGRVKEPGVKRAPSGVTVRELIDGYCGGMAEGSTFKAYLPGGASGGVLPASMDDIPLDFGTLEKYGCLVGSAAVVILDESDSVKGAVLNLLEFFADESCGQCTPCRLGCEKMVKLLQADGLDDGLIGELGAAMRQASICGLGQAAPNSVDTALTHFAGEFS